MARYTYPAIFEPEDGLYNVSFPDIPDCYTCGDNRTDAMFMAEDALAGYLARAEELCRPIPQASSTDDLSLPSGAFSSYVPADTEAFRRRNSEKAVKKTLSIPSWMNEAAESRGVNFSQVLQDALRHTLGMEA